MNRRALLAGLVAAAALCACNHHAGGVGLNLAEPSSLAVASALSHKHLDPVPWPFAFVANTARNELVVMDAIDDKVLSAPIVLRPLSIPVLDPRPALVAGAEFQAPAGAAPRPGLLVVASAGSTQLQLVRTWLSASASDPGLSSEAPVELGGQVLALLAAPAVDAAGSPVPDAIRVVAALVDGRLAVVDYAWTGDPTLAETDAGGGKASAAGTAAVHDIGFDALALAVDPRNPRYLYAATVETAEGVAQFDLAGAGAWTPVAIDAGGPTRLVAALTLRERSPSAAGTYDQVTSPDVPANPDDAFEATEVRRVYAVRDPTSCGPSTARVCGIVVLDPDTRTLARPAFLGGQAPFPITVPSQPVALLAGRPPVAPPEPSDSQPTETAALMRIHAVSSRLTTGVLAIPCQNGRIYFADLARWEVPSSEYEVNGVSTATGVSSYTATTASSRRIGFYEPAYLAEDITRRSWALDSAASSFLQLTPGFTPADTWTVTYQGYLPAFAASRAAQVTASGADLVVAFQVPTHAGSSTFTQVVDVYDPAQGVREGDIVEIWTGPTPNDPGANQKVDEGTLCPDTTTTGSDGLDIQPVEGRILSVHPPDPGHPGGWLLVRQARADECVVWDGTKVPECKTRGPWTDKPNCWASLSVPAASGGANPGTLQVRIRASGGTAGAELQPAASRGWEFVVAGAATGYAGRAVSTRLTPPWTTPTFAFTSEHEAELVAACPLLSGGTCGDEACRRACEAAYVARRARRTHLTSVACPPNSSATRTHCEWFFPAFVQKDAGAAFPSPTGPSLAFSLSLACLAADVEGCVPEQISANDRALARDAQVAFTTRSGWTPAARYGGGANGGAGTLPSGVAYIDRTADNARFDHQNDRYRFLVPYVDNMVLDVSFGQTNGNTRVVR